MALKHIKELISNDETDHVAEYECPSGLCVMINNMDFEDTNLKNLLGGENDQNLIVDTFESFGFQVKIHRNLTAAEMTSTVEGYSAMEHKGAFFLIISSHGGAGDVVYGVDDHDKGTVAVHDLVKCFNRKNCPSLAGIPKVFVIDACRGTGNEEDENDAAKTNNKNGNNAKPGGLADTMTIFSSTRGMVANCSQDEGSLFIQIFTTVLKKHATKMHLSDIMKKTQEFMEKQKYKKQIPICQSSFKRHYYIGRHNHNAGVEEQVEQVEEDMKKLSMKK